MVCLYLNTTTYAFMSQKADGLKFLYMCVCDCDDNVNPFLYSDSVAGCDFHFFAIVKDETIYVFNMNLLEMGQLGVNDTPMEIIDVSHVTDVNEFISQNLI